MAGVDVPVAVGGAIDLQLVMTDRALLDGDDAPHLTGYGPVPAALAWHSIATSRPRPDVAAAKESCAGWPAPWPAPDGGGNAAISTCPALTLPSAGA